MVHLEVRDAVRDDALRAEVRRRDDVGDVAVHEDVAWFQGADGCFRDAGVGAADPEDLGGLAFCEGGEEVWVRGRGGFGPLLVLVQDAFEVVCGEEGWLAVLGLFFGGGDSIGGGRGEKGKGEVECVFTFFCGGGGLGVGFCGRVGEE